MVLTGVEREEMVEEPSEKMERMRILIMRVPVVEGAALPQVEDLMEEQEMLEHLARGGNGGSNGSGYGGGGGGGYFGGGGGGGGYYYDSTDKRAYTTGAGGGGGSGFVGGVSGGIMTPGRGTTGNGSAKITLIE